MIKDGYTETMSVVGDPPKHPEAQFRLEQLIIRPFDATRVYATDGRWTWQLDDRQLQPTGIQVLDRYLRWLSDGSGDTSDFCRRERIDPTHLNGLVRLTTSYTCKELQQHIHMRVANMLLTGTNLPLVDVVRRSGIHSRTAFSRDYAAYWGLPPKDVRKMKHPDLFRVAPPLVSLGKVGRRPMIDFNFIG